MVKEKLKLIIAHGHSSLEVFHSLIPFIFLANDTNNYDIQFIDYQRSELHKLSGDIIILIRKFHKLDIRENRNISNMINYVKKLKNNFSKVIYFDDSAAISHILFFIVPYVDSYWVRGLFKDTNLYSKSFYGGRSFSDYYNKMYNIKDKDTYLSPKISGPFPNNIKIAWNIGIGCYPTANKKIINYYYSNIRKISCSLAMLSNIKILSFIVEKYIKEMTNVLSKDINLADKKELISARFSSRGYYNSIGFHRELAIKKILNNKLFIKGKTSKWNYIKECNSIFGMLSPFGWGEICYRDFESAIGGNLLIKPNMDHINTWPNIYRNDCYFKLDWDYNNIDEINEIITSENRIIECVRNSRKIYLDSLNECKERLEKLISELF